MSSDIRVGMLIFLQPDIDKAVEFYEKLGFKKKFHLKNQWAEFEIGDVKLGLCPTDQKIPDHHTGVVLQVNDLQKIYDELKDKGVEFAFEPKVAQHGIMTSFKDPGNNFVDLYQPTPERVKEVVENVAKDAQDVDCEKGDDCCKSDCDA